MAKFSSRCPLIDLPLSMFSVQVHELSQICSISSLFVLGEQIRGSGFMLFRTFGTPILVIRGT